MYMYLPVALTSVNFLLVSGIGFTVGMLSGLFGVGGGWLMTPLLMMIGIPPTIAAGTDANQIVAASTSGMYTHWRLGNVDYKMGICLLIGSFLGGAFGVQVIKVLTASGGADFLIKITYVLMLGIVGSFMFVESLTAMKKAKSGEAKPAAPKDNAKKSLIMRLPLQTTFEKSGVSFSALVPVGLGAFVGLLAAIMGVGGGFLMVPVMIYMLRIPMHVVVGTSLFQILFTCIEVTFLQAYYNRTVDFLLALLLLIGSVFGAQIGAKLGRKLHGDQLKILLSVIVLSVTVKLVFDLILQPANLLSYAGGH